MIKQWSSKKWQSKFLTLISAATTASVGLTPTCAQWHNFIASPSVLVHVQEKRVQKLLLACIDIEDRCRYERVSGNPMRAQVPQTQCCHRIRHRLYCILHVGGVLLLEWLVQSRDQTDQSASTTLSCENVYSVKLFRVCGVETVLWESNEDRCNWDASNYDMQCAFDVDATIWQFFSYGNFNNTERHFFLLFCPNAGLFLSAVLFCILVWDGVVALYDSSDDVYELRADNFQKMVLDSDFVWVVEFYAPWWATTALIHTAATTSWI